ncbi:hypothetical protein BVC80_1833g54 [Macleaya cordata]|uniref:Retrotransposon Copia-like N-terminal domain-containing protein n=1 Tax=Macleaya cordata TaxID=56857 RepID=A0A200R6N6_MACCD|nr:hypothetical protein BVC80_1833g54 [Macleaya cordata]
MAAQNINVPNVTNLVSVKMDGSNFLLWKNQMVPLLVSQDLMGYVDGSFAAPPPEIDDGAGHQIANPAYGQWRRADQFVYGIIWPEYESFTTTILHRDTRPTFSDLRARMLSHELRLRHLTAVHNQATWWWSF